MTDDTITYDYAAIDQCLSMMSKKAQEIQTQTDNLESDVKKIMVDWEGATAQSYDRLANDLRNDLTQNRENLDNLNKTSTPWGCSRRASPFAISDHPHESRNHGTPHHAPHRR